MRLNQRKSSERGAVHVLVALFIIPLLCCMALAIDGFLVITSNLQQNNNAEYAALAVLKELRAQARAGTAIADRVGPAIARASVVAGSDLNSYVGRRDVKAVSGKELEDGRAGTVRLGRFNPSTGDFILGSTQPIYDSLGNIVDRVYTAAEVSLRTQSSGRNTTIHTLFAGIMGAHELGMKSVAYACYDPARDTAGQSPFYLCKPGAVTNKPPPAPAACDEDGNGYLGRPDAQQIIDFLNTYGALNSAAPKYQSRLDNNSDNWITAIDALICINFLNEFCPTDTSCEVG